MGVRAYFPIFFDKAEALRDMTDEERGKFLLWIMNYAQLGESPSKDELSDRFLRSIFYDFCKAIDYSNDKYQELCQKRAEAGRLGGKAKARNQAENDSQQVPANASNAKQSLANLAKSKSMSSQDQVKISQAKSKSMSSQDTQAEQTTDWTDDAKRIYFYFVDAFGRDPSETFMQEIEKHLSDGMALNDINASIDKAKKKKPDSPDRYVLAILASNTSQQDQTVHMDQSERPLEEWEKDWIEEQNAIAKETEKTAIGEPITGNPDYWQ